MNDIIDSETDSASTEVVETPSPKEPLSLDKAISSRMGAEGTPPPQTPEVIEYPKTWKKDYADKWNALPPEYQKYIREREEHFSTTASKWGNEKNNLTRTTRELDLALSDYAEDIASGQTSHAELLKTFAQADRMIKENPALAIMNIANAHNIDLRRLTEVHPMEYQNLALQGQLARRQWEDEAVSRATMLERQAEATAVLEEFASEVGPDGQPLRPYLQHVANDLAPIITQIKQYNPSLPDRDVLQAAYEHAVKNHELVQQLEQYKQSQLQSQQTQRADRARRASGVRSSSGSVPNGPKKLDDIINKRISNLRT